MGNTVTKESGSYSAGLGDARDNLGGPACYAQVNRSGGAQLSETACCSGSRRHSSRGRHHHHHHHHGTKYAKGKPEGYEMKIDANETVDGGYLFPQGVYSGGQDFKVSVVREMIIRRRLAPFYKGLDAVEPEWTDEELLENVRSDVQPSGPPKPGQPGPPSKKQQIWLYRNVHECPICFLVYPRLNGTRCCGQDICTECFVQIKRNPPHPPYTSNENAEATDVLDLLSEPAACPYCAQPDLGVIFEAPPFEWGIPSASIKSESPDSLSSSRSITPNMDAPSASPPSVAPTTRKRRTSVPASHYSVVTIDMIRPDWEEKLASARRRLARKSAAARALHRSALLPRERADTPSAISISSNPAPVWSRRDPSSLSDIVNASRTMSAAQSRALEQRMIDEAIKASLAHD